MYFYRYFIKNAYKKRYFIKNAYKIGFWDNFFSKISIKMRFGCIFFKKFDKIAFLAKK